MGGNALKNTTTRRYSRTEYEALREIIIGKMATDPVFAGRKVMDVLSYQGKESFGDMDLLVESDGLGPTLWDSINNLFQPNELILNGPTCSFNVEELQVDLLLQPNASYEAAYVYFAYNDLGNLMGRVAYKLGFKYGHDGLYYLPRTESGDIIEEILLTTDYRESFAFLGYDHKEWDAGFKCLEEIFRFTVTTPYFHKDYYNLETRSHAARVRDKKRATYRSFLEWIETQHDVPQYDWENNRQANLERAFATFPGFKERLENAWKNHELHMAAKNRFNGEVVAKLTGLSGNELGQWIQGFKKQWQGDTQFHAWVTESSDKEVQDRVANDFRLNKIELREREVPIFSRDNVRDWTGLGGSALAQFMTSFRQNWIDQEKFQAWLTTQTKDTLEQEVRRYNDSSTPRS